MPMSSAVTQRVSLLDRSLLVVFGVTVCMALIASIAAYVVMTRAMVEERLSELQRESRHRADLIEVFLDRRLDALQAAADALPRDDELPTPETMTAWLQNQQTLLEQFNQGLLFFDEDGVAVAESQYVPERLGTGYADRPHFQVVMMSRQPYRAAPIVGRATGLPLLSYLVPLMRDDGTLKGLLGGVMEVNEDTINSALRRFQSTPQRSSNNQSETRSRWILDPINRLYVSHPDEDRIMSPLPPPGEDRLVDAVWSNQLEPVMRLDDGQRWAVASVRLDTLGWVMVEAEPYDTIVQPVLNTLMRYFALMLVALLAMLLVANSILRRAIEPLTQATAHIDQMILNPGSYPRLPPSHIREVDRLSWAFNELSDQRSNHEQRLSEERDRFQALFAQHLDGLLLVDADSERLVECNPALSRMTESTQDELLDTPLEELFHGDHEQQRFLDWFRRLKAGLAPEAEEFMLAYHEGTSVVEVQGSLIHGADTDTALGVLLSLRDVTERHRLEKSKDAFIATVSHELKTPLTAISGSLRLLDSGAAGELPGQARSMVGLAVKNSQRLLGIVNDLLDISRVLAGKMHFSLEAVFLPPLMEEALASNRDLANQHRIELESHVPDYSVQADANRLRQIMDNLINNAIKFSPENSEVSIGAYRSDGQICLWVLDSGPGIPEEFEDRIFQRFAQADESDRRAQQGTGLGLAICRELAEGMGGHIDFETGRSQGALFRVWLPLSDDYTDH